MMLFVVAVMSALAGIALAKLAHHMLMRRRLNPGFVQASDAFFSHAEKLLKTEGPLPENVLQVLDFGGRLLTDRKAPAGLYMALKRARTSTPSADMRRKWTADIEAMSAEQVKLFAAANKALTHAVMCMSTSYAEKIRALMLEEVLEIPERKVRTAEIKIGFEVISDLQQPKFGGMRLLEA